MHPCKLPSEKPTCSTNEVLLTRPPCAACQPSRPKERLDAPKATGCMPYRVDSHVNFLMATATCKSLVQAYSKMKERISFKRVAHFIYHTHRLHLYGLRQDHLLGLHHALYWTR